MNKRFVWNFELKPTAPFKQPSADADIKEEKWESRYFWNENQIIPLQSLDETFLHLSNYKIKHREDVYCILPTANYNIKIRGDRLLYKPLLTKEGAMNAYGKKINLEEYAPGIPLPGTDGIDSRKLMALVHHEGRQTRVEKEALIYTFETTPRTKLELAWLRVAQKSYYSVNIEARSKTLVLDLAKQLLGDLSSCDYVAFLRQIVK